MKTVTIHAAMATLSKLVARAEAGEEIVLARGKVPIAKIVPTTQSRRSASSARCPARSEFFLIPCQKTNSPPGSSRV